MMIEDMMKMVHLIPIQVMMIIYNSVPLKILGMYPQYLIFLVIYHNEAVGIRDILECFHLFLPKNFHEDVLQQTNLYADQTRTSKHNTRPWVPVCIEELLAFVGLVIAMGAISLPSYKDNIIYNTCNIYYIYS